MRFQKKTFFTYNLMTFHENYRILFRKCWENVKAVVKIEIFTTIEKKFSNFGETLPKIVIICAGITVHNSGNMSSWKNARISGLTPLFPSYKTSSESESRALLLMTYPCAGNGIHYSLSSLKFHSSFSPQSLRCFGPGRRAKRKSIHQLIFNRSSWEVWGS
jgi:hypothetical protein